MAKKFFYVCMGILALAGAYSIGSNNIPSSAIGAEDEFAPVGRYQIFQGSYQWVNSEKGSSIEVNTVFRLDSVTGAVEEFNNGVSKEGEHQNFWSRCGDD